MTDDPTPPDTAPVEDLKAAYAREVAAEARMVAAARLICRTNISDAELAEFEAANAELDASRQALSEALQTVETQFGLGR